MHVFNSHFHDLSDFIPAISSCLITSVACRKGVFCYEITVHVFSGYSFCCNIKSLNCESCCISRKKSLELTRVFLLFDLFEMVRSCDSQIFFSS